MPWPIERAEVREMGPPQNAEKAQLPLLIDRAHAGVQRERFAPVHFSTSRKTCPLAGNIPLGLSSLPEEMLKLPTHCAQGHV